MIRASRWIRIACLPVALAASMLMTLQASVGSECVTGVMTPITPKGAYSCSAMPFSPLKASVRRNSTPGMRSALR